MPRSRMSLSGSTLSPLVEQVRGICCSLSATLAGHLFDEEPVSDEPLKTIKNNLDKLEGERLYEIGLRYHEDCGKKGIDVADEILWICSKGERDQGLIWLLRRRRSSVFRRRERLQHRLLRVMIQFPLNQRPRENRFPKRSLPLSTPFQPSPLSILLSTPPSDPLSLLTLACLLWLFPSAPSLSAPSFALLLVSCPRF
jgi:hypothetical protein